MSAARLQVGGNPLRNDTILASALSVDTLVVAAKVWMMGEGAHSIVRTSVNLSGAELWLVEDAMPTAPLELQTRRLLIGAGSLVGGSLVDADSLLLFSNGMVLAGRLRLGTYGLINTGTLTGRAGSIEILGEFDLNPTGAASAVQIVTPEGATTGSDLVILNNGTIRKRGLGTATVRACFDPAGTGSVVVDGGANPPTIEMLPCS